MIEQIIEQPQEYRIFHTKSDNILDNGTRFGTLEELQADFPDSNWAIIPMGEVPVDWQDMTIVDGALVLASAEVIAAREVARLATETETVRQARAVRYVTETDPLMIDALEAYATVHPEDPAFSAWLAAKERIKEELPKLPQIKEG